MILRRFGALASALFLACSPLNEVVFTPIALEPSAPLVVREGAGVVVIPLRLKEAPSQDLAASYRVIGIEAQNGCQIPDFEAAEGSVAWPAGSTDAEMSVWVGDDDLAETDERFEVRLEPLGASPGPLATQLEIVITDDDRTALVNARDFGVVPGSPADQAEALQSALDQASATGRGVVVMDAGDYDISRVDLHAGTTLSARGARWHRPPESAVDLISLSLVHTGSNPSEASLVEGLGIDGRREVQGPYRNRERQDAHLIALSGDSERGGRVRAALESLTLVSGTASGILVGPESEVSVCGLSASELWRDAVTVTGGGTIARLRDIDATATEGTGLWLGARTEGYQGNLGMDAEVENVQVGAGDVEIEAGAGSTVTLRRLTMTRAPFRLDAPDGVVRIVDSVLMGGLPSSLHNHWGLPHDVEISGTTLVASESVDEGSFDESARTFAAVSVSAETTSSTTPAEGAGHLLFDRCRFEVDGDVDADDVVYAVENRDPNLSVVVRASTLGGGLTAWFAPECAGCSVTP